MGIRQFLDIGSGLPTQSNVHEVALAVAPAARVVYVDYDPVAIAHSRALLSDADPVAAVQADMRRPDDILRHPRGDQPARFHPADGGPTSPARRSSPRPGWSLPAPAASTEPDGDAWTQARSSDMDVRARQGGPQPWS